MRSARRFLSSTAAAELSDRGRAAGLKFFQFSFSDLFGVQRSKLVPASRVQEIAEGGAGFAGFAAHLDMDPTMGDLLALPDASTLTPLPWRKEVGWLACDLVHEGSELPHGPRNVLRGCARRWRSAGSRSRAASSASSSCSARPTRRRSPTRSTRRRSRATTRRR